MRRRLIRPEEIMAMRDDEQIILHGRGRPLRCGRPIYWRRPEMNSQAKPNPFVKETQNA